MRDQAARELEAPEAAAPRGALLDDWPPFLHMPRSPPEWGLFCSQLRWSLSHGLRAEDDHPTTAARVAALSAALESWDSGARGAAPQHALRESLLMMRADLARTAAGVAFVGAVAVSADNAHAASRVLELLDGALAPEE